MISGDGDERDLLLWEPLRFRPPPLDLPRWPVWSLPMGFLRLLLAASVVLNHSSAPFGFTLVDGRTAVECFFVISGFYMGLVLQTKYVGLSAGRRWRVFMASRLMRLYPVYVVVLVASLALAVVIHLRGNVSPLFDYRMGPFTAVLVVGSNLTMLAQDIVTFSSVDQHGMLYVSGLATNSRMPAHFLLLVPQAWSLSLELLFYAMAPWLTRRSTRLLVLVMALSVLARVAVIGTGHEVDPWTYRVFPLELSLFLIGVLAFRASRSRTFTSTQQRAAFLVAVLGVLSFPLFGANELVKLAFPYCFALLIPAIFVLTKNRTRDRWIGELSYPTYMVHVLVFDALTTAHTPRSGAVVLVGSLVMAIGLAVLVDAPVERVRQQRLRLTLPLSPKPV